MTSRDDFALPLDLPGWNQGIKALFGDAHGKHAPSNAPADVHPPHTSNPEKSARRVLAVNQAAPAHNYHHQKVIHDPKFSALHVDGLSQLPTARDAEFWLNKASTLEPKEAEQVLMEALQRDVQPVTSIAKALHELHKAVENSPAPQGRVYYNDTMHMFHFVHNHSFFLTFLDVFICV